jgi:hypothetical protein
VPNTGGPPQQGPSEIIQGRPPSPEQEFYYQWGLETLKNNFTVLNDVLRQLVTLSASVLGGSIAFLSPRLIGTEYKNAVVITFFMSLVFAFFGMMPYEGKFDPQRPDSVKLHKGRAVKWKRTWVWITAASLTAGFLLATVGMWKHSQ